MISTCVGACGLMSRKAIVRSPSPTPTGGPCAGDNVADEAVGQAGDPVCSLHAGARGATTMIPTVGKRQLGSVGGPRFVAQPFLSHYYRPYPGSRRAGRAFVRP